MQRAKVYGTRILQDLTVGTPRATSRFVFRFSFLASCNETLAQPDDN